MSSASPPSFGPPTQQAPAAQGPSLWHNRTFVRLFLAQLVSQFGSGITTVALALFAYQRQGLTGAAGSATAVLGDALMLRILAFLLFSQPVGVLADRLDRKKILVAADLSRFVLLGLFPFVQTVGQIEALVFAINAVTAFFAPTYEATLPQVAGSAHYVKALSLSRITVDVETIAGPVFAGLLVALIGARFVFWVDALSYLVSGGLILTVALPRAPAEPDEHGAGGAGQGTWLSMRRLLPEVSLGTRVLLREPSLRQALLFSFGEATAGAAAIVVTVAYIEGVLRRGATTFSLVTAGLSVGSAGAALLIGRLNARFEAGAESDAALHGKRHAFARAALLVGGLLLALSLLPGALVPPLPVFALLWGLNGMGQACIAMASSTLLAEHTFAEERGRAYAAHFALTHAFWLFTYPAVGHAAARFGAADTFTACGVLCLGVLLLALYASRKGAPGAHTHSRG